MNQEIQALVFISSALETNKKNICFQIDEMKDPDLISDAKDMLTHQLHQITKTEILDSLTSTQTANVKVLPCNNQIKELHTVLRDRTTSRSDFRFYADRLIRLIVEEGLNQLPYVDTTITTPIGCEYKGLKYLKGVCGVSIMRSGEAMEKGLRECCRGIRIGKILIQSVDGDSHNRSAVYAKFCQDITTRKILLLYPVTTSGCTVNLAIKVLKEHGVCESNIVVLTLFVSPLSIQKIIETYPDVNILTSEIHPLVPSDFGQRYFGTE